MISFEGIFPHKSISSFSVIFFMPLKVSFVYRKGFEKIFKSYKKNKKINYGDLYLHVGV